MRDGIRAEVGRWARWAGLDPDELLRVALEEAERLLALPMREQVRVIARAREQARALGMPWCAEAER